ncbi:MAG: acyl--CoA ligase [Cyanobacteria bacterium CRU_2_1]|nr:acyl--CoA ligase [Cyanobacteria bacterium CRU_2_1]
MLQNAHAHAKSLGLNTDDRILSCLPFYHGMTLLTHIFSVLSLDATFVVGQDTFPQTISRMIKDFKVSYTSFVPSLLDVIICNFSYDLLDSEHLKKVSIGSAPVLAKQVRYYKEFFINQEVYVTYGQTEAGPRISTLAVNPVSEQLWDTVGLPLAGTEIRIANPDKDRVGELQVKSDWQMLGYYGEETDAGIWDEGWLRTGDLAKLTEQGYIRLCGRKKDLIISGGVNISPAEIEAVLNDIPWVVEAVVVPAPDKKRGEVPHAFVVRDGSGTKQEILSILRNRLDHLKVPKKIHFIDKMPRNAIGKTDRLSLRPYLNSPN